MNFIRNSTVEFLIFTSQTGEDSIEVRVEDEAVWVTEKLIAELFSVNAKAVSEHLRNIFKGTELHEESVIRKFRNTASDSKKYLAQFLLARQLTQIFGCGIYREAVAPHDAVC